MHLEMLEGINQPNQSNDHLTCQLSNYIQTFLFLFLFNRLIGLCLLQNELFPLFLQRHVLKYLLGRPIRFHDLAFFDPIVYESLRQLICESMKSDGAQILASLELNFV